MVCLLLAELKSILSGHVNYKKTEKPAIKIEKSTDEETGEQPREEVTATPTPVRARRGRAKKASPPVCHVTITAIHLTY